MLRFIGAERAPELKHFPCVMPPLLLLLRFRTCLSLLKGDFGRVFPLIVSSEDRGGHVLFMYVEVLQQNTEIHFLQFKNIRVSDVVFILILDPF